jgi:hypothetical protein
MNFTKLQSSSSASSNKVLKEGNGSFDVAALGGAGETFGIATIPHGFNGDNLLFQAAIFSDTVGMVINLTTLPWQSSDGRIIAYTYLDANDKTLNIVVISSDVSGFGANAFTVKYDYRVLIP